MHLALFEAKLSGLYDHIGYVSGNNDFWGGEVRYFLILIPLMCLRVSQFGGSNTFSYKISIWHYQLAPLVSQVMRVLAESEQFWRATGPSNLAYEWLAATKASKVWFSYSHNYTLANGAVFHSVCQVWLSSGPPELFTFSYYAWSWNWLRGRFTRMLSA